MSVLADANDHQAGLRLAQQRGVARAFGVGVRGFAIETVKGRHRHVIEKPVAKEVPEGGRMVRRHTRVLIHVECRDPRPIDILRAQAGEKRVLRHR